MGIPYYFKYLTKKHTQVLSSTNPLKTTQVDYLLMDCNSIVYDSVRLLQNASQEVTNETVIDQVLFRIWEYIQMICPRKVIYIAFDGVAPLSKMKQQKTRRYKTAAQAATMQVKTQWSTTCITPGTPFMQQLSQSVLKAFSHKEREAGVEQILVSTSEEVGEGEHKLFQWLRRQGQDQTVQIMVYGMDADLIMLSLLHLPLVGPQGQICVFRESPLKATDTTQVKDKDEEELTFVDIQQLGMAIRQEMNLEGIVAIREYIFLCFFLGNDFLPHFPSMNIRTHGISTLLETYKSLGPRHFFIDSYTGCIQWNQVRRFIQQCAICEHEWLLQEYVVRDKMQKYLVLGLHEDEWMENAPIILRGVEMYIQPRQGGWRQRYYDSLFPTTDANPRAIVANYLEGLQWVYTYYNSECLDWQWQYRYSYPPLWTDLAKHFIPPSIPPSIDKSFTKKVGNKPFTPEQQLAYIMPPNAPLELHYQWSFCRYLWEAHIF